MSDLAQEIIVCYSLIDLTKTDVIGTYKPTVNGDQGAWNFRRNQQRNWESMIQLIGLRAQPVHLTDPVILDQRDLRDYRFSDLYSGHHRVWTFEFASEHAGVFGQDFELLIDDVHNVPINVGLTETVSFPTPVFDAMLHHNVYFSTKVDNK